VEAHAPAVVRAATIEDAAEVARLSTLVYPAELATAHGLRHWWAATPERARRRMWVAEKEGAAVGFASASLSFSSAEPGAAFANLYVHPERRRRGIGAALWERAESHLGELGASHVNSFGLDEEPSRRFMAARGFEVTHVQRMSRLDLASLGPPAEPPEHVTLVAYAELHDPGPVYELEVEALQDVPVDQPFDDVRYEDWQARWWDNPELDRDASLLALVGGVPAAFTTLMSDPESGRAISGMTGTARRFRGRGLALLVKHHALSRAAAHGITIALTENDEQNAPMLAVNERLGYRPVATNATFSRRS
jgi:GNAT superfamily N-acetyltransferase